MDGAQLDERVRRLLACGALPRKPPMKIFAGRGGGAVCAVCAVRIVSPAFEFELDYGAEGSLRVHRDCHESWEKQRRALS